MQEVVPFCRFNALFRDPSWDCELLLILVIDETLLAMNLHDFGSSLCLESWGKIWITWLTFQNIAFRIEERS